METRKTLVVSYDIVDRDMYQKVHNLFLDRCVKMSHWHGIVPPHRMEYTIGPLTDLGIKNWVAKFTELEAKISYQIKEEEV